MSCPTLPETPREADVVPRTIAGIPDRHDLVCITGGAGYFGQAMTRHLLQTTTNTIVRCIDQDEWGLKQAEAAFGHHPRLRWVLSNIRDSARLHLAFRDADIVIHAAALKHIDTCERNPSECIATNALGSQNVAQAAIHAGVRRAVFLSSDKAVAPTTVYGASKMLAEKAWIQHNAYSPEGTAFMATRYGNVAGSRGSVLDVFAAQLGSKGTLLVTNPQASRFWMQPGEAVALVEWAMTEGPRGGVFVPELPAFSLHDLLCAIEHHLDRPMSRLVTGLRPTEKLHEQLLMEDELRQAIWTMLPCTASVVAMIPPAYPTWNTPEMWEISPQGIQACYYHSGATPWRLKVPDLVAKLQAMGWPGEPTC